MTEEQAGYLTEILDHEGVEYELYPDYSGRCMYGSKTHGVVVNNLADVLVAALNCALDHDERPRFTSFRYDNMGYDMILY